MYLYFIEVFIICKGTFNLYLGGTRCDMNKLKMTYSGALL